MTPKPKWNIFNLEFFSSAALFSWVFEFYSTQCVRFLFYVCSRLVSLLLLRRNNLEIWDVVNSLYTLPTQCNVHSLCFGWWLFSLFTCVFGGVLFAHINKTTDYTIAFKKCRNPKTKLPSKTENTFPLVLKMVFWLNANYTCLFRCHSFVQHIFFFIFSSLNLLK